MDIVIRQIETADINQLQNISCQTFIETFADVNSEENMQAYLAESLSAEELLAELTNPNSVFYFAESNGRIIGYLKLNLGQAQTELKDSRGIEIERIYVLKEFHGKNVGQLLYNKAMQIAKENNAGYVWLGVWEENPRAIKFYQKNGFVEFDKHIFKLGNDEQVDLMMKLELKQTSDKV